MPATSPEAKERHRQYLRDLYEWYKVHGICTYCKTRWCAPGKTYCEVCIRKSRNSAEKRDPGRVARNQYTKDRYMRLKAAGLCPICGNPTDGTHTQCSACHEKFLVYNKRHREKAKREALEALEALRSIKVIKSD